MPSRPRRARSLSLKPTTGESGANKQEKAFLFLWSQEQEPSFSPFPRPPCPCACVKCRCICVKRANTRAHACKHAPADARTVVLLDLDAEREYIVPLQEDVPLKARRKSDFGGKKRLEFSDLEPGQIVRLTYATADRRILRVKVVGPGDES